MLYDEISNSELLTIYEGFDCNDIKKVKTCVVTDGVVENVDNEFLPTDLTNVIKLDNNGSDIEKVLNEVCTYNSKRIKINNASFISVFHYVLILEDNKWFLHDAKHKVNHNFRSLDKIKFLLHQTLIPLCLVVSQEPNSINVGKLNDKVKSKRLSKKLDMHM